MTVKNINRNGDPIEITGKTPKKEDFPALYKIIERIQEGEKHEL